MLKCWRFGAQAYPISVTVRILRTEFMPVADSAKGAVEKGGGYVLG